MHRVIIGERTRIPIMRAKGFYGMLENGGKFTAIYHSGYR